MLDAAEAHRFDQGFRLKEQQACQISRCDHSKSLVKEDKCLRSNGWSGSAVIVSAILIDIEQYDDSPSANIANRVCSWAKQRRAACRDAEAIRQRYQRYREKRADLGRAPKAQQPTELVQGLRSTGQGAQWKVWHRRQHVVKKGHRSEVRQLFTVWSRVLGATSQTGPKYHKSRKQGCPQYLHWSIAQRRKAQIVWAIAGEPKDVFNQNYRSIE